MTKKSMDIIGYPEPAIVFVPPLNAKFEPIHEEIPRLITPEQIDALRQRLEDSVRSACGRTSCRASVSITDKSSLSGSAKVIEAGEIECASEECPLNGPDSSGDREPRIPNPPLPMLAQSLPVEQDEPKVEVEHLIGSHL